MVASCGKGFTKEERKNSLQPLYGVNHLAAHVAVDRLEHGPLPEPAVALLVSGGHSSLLLVDDLTGHVSPLGSSVDDAAAGSPEYDDASIRTSPASSLKPPSRQRWSGLVEHSTVTRFARPASTCTEPNPTSRRTGRPVSAGVTA